MKNRTPEEIIRLARDVLASQRVVTLITQDASGYPDARIMEQGRDCGVECVRLVTALGTVKLEQIAANPRAAAFAYNAETGESIALYGDAVITRDPREKETAWTPEYEVYYPGGPENPRFTVILLKPVALSYMCDGERIFFELNAGKAV